MFRFALLALATGCYVPVPPEGAPCETDQQCPTPQRCIANACSTHARVVDAHGIDTPAPPFDAAVTMADASADAALPCSATGLDCPNGTVVFPCATSCVVLCRSSAPFATAANLCKNWMGTLAEIDDATKQTCLQSRVNGNTWVGLQQLDTATTPATGWTWNLAKPITFTHWQNGVPDDSDGNENRAEQCAKMQSDGTWDDVTCGTSLPFFCER